MRERERERERDLVGRSRRLAGGSPPSLTAARAGPAARVPRSPEPRRRWCSGPT